MIERLVNTPDNVRRLLGFSEGVPVDLSSMDWGERFVVVRGIHLDNATIAKIKLVANFVGCKFENCEFEMIVSNGRFSGAGNEWYGCRFKKCKLSDLIAPQSRLSTSK